MRRALLLAFSAALTLVLIEAGFRVLLAVRPALAPPRIRPRGLTSGLHVEAHPYLPFVLRPNLDLSDYTFVAKDSARAWKTTAYGTVGSDTPAIPKPAGVFRMLFLGGSTTFNPGSHVDGDWPHLVAARLNEVARSGTGTGTGTGTTTGTGTRRFEAINMGVPGYTSAENLVDYLLRGDQFEADLVVLYQGLNDLRWAGMTEGFKPDYSHARRQIGSVRANVINTLPELSWVKSYTVLRAALIRRFGGPVDASAADVRSPKEMFDERVLAVFRRNVTNLVTVAKRQGQRVLLISQKRRPSADIGAQLTYDKNRLFTDLLKDIAAREDVLFLDAAAELSATPSYFDDLEHFSDAGLAAMADLVAGAIRRAGETSKETRKP